MYYQVEVCALGEQFDVGAAAVDSILEVHLISENPKDRAIHTENAKDR